LISEFRESGNRRRLLPTISAEGVEVTAREFEVIERLRKRERTSEIAVALGISEVTVRRHVSAVLQKLGATSRRNAIELLDTAERQRLADGADQAASAGEQAPYRRATAPRRSGARTLSRVRIGPGDRDPGLPGRH
jgi:DNA-binding CsgD family transcriptional regulator